MTPIEIDGNQALVTVLATLGIRHQVLCHKNGTVRLQIYLTPGQDRELVRLWELLTDLQYRYLEAVRAGFIQINLWPEHEE
jgi:hypothetical protein